MFVISLGKRENQPITAHLVLERCNDISHLLSSGECD